MFVRRFEFCQRQRHSHALRALHPQAAEPLLPLPANHAPGVLVLNQLEKVLKQRVHNGSALGPSGWTGSHLWLLWQHGTADMRACREASEQFIARGF